MTLDELNAQPGDQAERALLQCCGSRQWARALVARRPFGNMSELHRAANDVWWSLDSGDWLEAFASHPRIGERGTGWSSEEQAGAVDASDETVATLARRNREYEERFGHVFLIYATGKSTGEMLANLDQRMVNQPSDELRVAAAEQAKITRLRLEKLLSTSFTA